MRVLLVVIFQPCSLMPFPCSSSCGTLVVVAASCPVAGLELELDAPRACAGPAPVWRRAAPWAAPKPLWRPARPGCAPDPAWANSGRRVMPKYVASGSPLVGARAAAIAKGLLVTMPSAAPEGFSGWSSASISAALSSQVCGNKGPNKKCCATGNLSSTSPSYILSRPRYRSFHDLTLAARSQRSGECSWNGPVLTSEMRCTDRISMLDPARASTSSPRRRDLGEAAIPLPLEPQNWEAPNTNGRMWKSSRLHTPCEPAGSRRYTLWTRWHTSK
mmetsp:Transcript_3294/g.9698  ORF Transcript_3294/g.9698 Transcript_3294/m.9698 type:complete len:274 (-) Transcript_3294:526-1347(-)